MQVEKETKIRLSAVWQKEEAFSGYERQSYVSYLMKLSPWLWLKEDTSIYESVWAVLIAEENIWSYKRGNNSKAVRNVQ
jgi:hypothetical protein